MNIPYARQSISEEDIEAVCEVLKSDWITQGPKVKEFEQKLAEYTGAKYTIAVSNGTLALQIACMVLGLDDNALGITSPISFIASANCIAGCGARVAFIDIDPETLCISVNKLEQYCKKNKVPDVVIPVDFAGIPAPLPEIRELSKRFGFKIIEDAAHAIGSTYKYNERKYHCGSCAHSDMAIFSFHPVKTITTGEGGVILTNDPDLARKAKLLANHGVEREKKGIKHYNIFSSNEGSSFNIPPWYYEMHYLGYNGRITDIQCALGISQLNRIEEFKKRRQKIVMAYNDEFKELEERGLVILPPLPDGSDPCYHLYPLRLTKRAPLTRDEFFIKLREKGIYAQVHYIPIYRHPYYRRQGFQPEDFPEAETYFSGCISLPLFPGLSDNEFHYVVDTVFHLLNNTAIKDKRAL